MNDIAAYLAARLDEDLRERIEGSLDSWHTITCGYDQVEDLSRCSCNVPSALLDDVAHKRAVLSAWDLAAHHGGAEGSFAWVLIRDIVIRPWYATYASRDDYLGPIAP